MSFSVFVGDTMGCQFSFAGFQNSAILSSALSWRERKRGDDVSAVVLFPLEVQVTSFLVDKTLCVCGKEWLPEAGPCSEGLEREGPNSHVLFAFSDFDPCVRMQTV